jgi:hypothetical protein
MVSESLYDCELEINKIKGQLMVKVMKKGLVYEYFGDKERRKLEDKYATYIPQIANAILKFEEWCNNYTL